jgi:hypothetical protein
MIALPIEPLGLPDTPVDTPAADRRWFFLGLSRADLQAQPSDFSRIFDPSLDAAGPDQANLQEMDVVLWLEAALAGRFADSAAELMRLFTAGTRTVVILVPWSEPPYPEAKGTGLVTSFMCSAAVLQDVLPIARSDGPYRLCYNLLYTAMNGQLALDKLLVRQLPCLPSPPLPHSLPPAALIVPHRGDLVHLTSLLHFVACASAESVRPRIALDTANTGEYETLADRYPFADFLSVNPAPAGPYVIRQQLAQSVPEPLLILQDSDDTPCSDRFTALYAAMCAEDCDFIGSHELRVDEILREVVAIRFPLDVNEALRQLPGHALLHATAMIKREAFFRAGGLSTDQRVAYDSQFLMRAYFYLRIRNVDQFLYLRRRHRAALTVYPETANGTPLRLNMDRAWRADFRSVQNGQMAIEDSSLRPSVSKVVHRLIPLPGARQTRTEGA